MKKEYFDSYGRVIRDYFWEFIRGFCMERASHLILFLAAGTFTVAQEGWWDRIRMDGLFQSWFCGLPILYALASGVSHTVSLPFMLYLVPCSRKRRERYIQRMLQVKIAVPVAFGCAFDAAAAVAGTLSLYVFVLQMASIVFLSCLCGMLNEDGIYTAEKRAAYGELQPFAPALLVICRGIGMAMFIVCMGSVSQVGYWVIFSVMLLFPLPVLVAVGKRWKQIRSNFADYETAVKMGE